MRDTIVNIILINQLDKRFYVKNFTYKIHDII